MARQHSLLLVCGLLLQVFSVFCVREADPSSIETAHIIFNNHLDVGFDGIDPIPGFARNVVNKYFDEYFPKAISVASELRRRGGEERLVYTVNCWLVSIYLDCPPNMGVNCPAPEAVLAFRQAVSQGDITWHAFPFNSQLEFYDPSMVDFGLTVCADLSAQFNITTSVLSQRDVPSMTRSVLPLLQKRGIQAITIGVNGASMPLDVPKVFLWQDLQSRSEMITMYHPRGYGGIELDDCVTVDGMTHALAFAIREDNAGPPDVDEVIENFKTVRNNFPKARVMASTYPAFVSELIQFKDKLTVVTQEGGDTWIHGIASDPLKVAQFRALSRARTECIESKGAWLDCQPASPHFYNFSRLLLKNGEHTWGGDVKTFLDASHQPWYSHWSNDAFYAIRSRHEVQDLEATWREQRAWGIQFALDALPSGRFKDHLLDTLAAIRPQSRSMLKLDGFTLETDPLKTFKAGGFELSFDWTTGGINHLRDAQSGMVWATLSNQLGFVTYQTFTESDFLQFLSEYIVMNPIQEWAYLDFGKSNLSTANPETLTVSPSIVHLYSSSNQDGHRFMLELNLREELRRKYGAPEETWVELFIPTNRTVIDMTLRWFGKRPTRIPESIGFHFNPSAPASQDVKLLLDKLHLPVDASDVMFNGSQHLHAVNRGVRFHQEPSGRYLDIAMRDSALVSVGEPNPFPVPMRAPEISKGVSANLYNNIWGTNYIMWYPFLEEDADAQFRFQLKFGRDEPVAFLS
eukprot:GILJ01005632.1.p1 GENE.GILJ01005632.1~~GILJ01005632.1.p1  ORF type:complete len:745 (+),score=92.80 GILJ01005632.1:37-2271(+)